MKFQKIETLLQKCKFPCLKTNCSVQYEYKNLSDIFFKNLSNQELKLFFQKIESNKMNQLKSYCNSKLISNVCIKCKYQIQLSQQTLIINLEPQTYSILIGKISWEMQFPRFNVSNFLEFLGKTSIYNDNKHLGENKEKERKKHNKCVIEDESGEIYVNFEENCKWIDTSGFRIEELTISQLLIDNIICGAYGYLIEKIFWVSEIVIPSFNIEEKQNVIKCQKQNISMELETINNNSNYIAFISDVNLEQQQQIKGLINFLTGDILYGELSQVQNFLKYSLFQKIVSQISRVVFTNNLVSICDKEIIEYQQTNKEAIKNQLYQKFTKQFQFLSKLTSKILRSPKFDIDFMSGECHPKENQPLVEKAMG